jgi:hypothetical protein
MNIAANQAIYPQTATHLPYPNGAIIQNPMQQTASLVKNKFSFSFFYKHNLFLRHPILILDQMVQANQH